MSKNTLKLHKRINKIVVVVYLLILVILSFMVTRLKWNLIRFFLFFTRESRMLHASLPLYGRLSVRPSVRSSITLVICIKTVQA